MNTTGQSSHIESLISESVKREKKADVIQKLYLLCIEEFSEQDFDTLIQLIEESVLSWIRKQLWIAGCYSEDEENTILQDARLAVWNAVQSAVKGSEIIGKFAFYALGIYKNKARDRIRSISRQRKKYTFVTIRRQDDEEEENWEDVYPPYHEDYGEKEERRKVYEGLFRLYCSTLMSSKAFPPGALLFIMPGFFLIYCLKYRIPKPRLPIVLTRIIRLLLIFRISSQFVSMALRATLIK